MLTPKSVREARMIQMNIRNRVKLQPLKKQPRFVAGVDAAFTEKKIIAAACLFSYPEMCHLEDAHMTDRISFPYIPGLLSFREAPAMMKAVARLKILPDLLIIDGQGIAHPLRVGIAAHMGVLLDIPTIGCAKSRLVGHYEMPGKRKGCQTSLVHRRKVIGKVVRTREHVKPLFVSPGHLIDLAGSVSIVLACAARYRLPEPVRKADWLARKLKKDSIGR